jgi:hypothetical protein
LAAWLVGQRRNASPETASSWQWLLSGAQLSAITTSNIARNSFTTI